MNILPFYFQEAEALGRKDEERLLQTRKLSLVVDLDQTLIHTTMELIPEDMEVQFVPVFLNAVSGECTQNCMK